MLRNKPKLQYSGLTVVLAHPSRLDRASLLSGNGGLMFNNDILRPELNTMQCDVRLADCPEPLLPGTKVVLCLGEAAMHSCMPHTSNNTLGEMRGSVWQNNGVWYIASYFPQDVVDIKNFEAEFNTQYDAEEEEDEDNFDSVKRHGATKRRNYFFWLKADIKKVKYLLTHGAPPVYEQPTYKIAPAASEVVEALNSTTGGYLYFDMETDWGDSNMQCFAFSFDGRTIYSVPTLDYNYRPVQDIHLIMTALVNAIDRNTIVAHNGAAFDFIVLAWKYGIPIRKAYDTMLAMHRCFVDVEKSLGHCLTGDTLVDTVCGKVPIKDLVGRSNFHVWSWKNGVPYPARVRKAWKTRENAELVRVNVWRKTNKGSGATYEKTYIDCTPDHKFLVNGCWIEASNLKNGDSLTRVRIEYGKEYNSYDRISYTNSAGEEIRERVHRYIFECLNGSLEKDFVHHEDENKWNNEPSNLKRMSEFDHNSLHIKRTQSEFKMQTTVAGCFKNGITKQWDYMSKETLEQLYNSGMSQAEIGARYGTSQASIRSLMKRHGIKSRTHQEGQKLFYKKFKNCTVLSVEKLEEKQDVYCLDVEDTECFSANNIIVHNCTSYWTWETFHKDEDSQGYMTPSQMQARLKYCGKDVYTMFLIHQAIEKYASTIPGLSDSIACVMRGIRPYLTTTIQGIRYDQEEVNRTRKENDELMVQYLRIINLLIGPSGMEEVRSAIKTKARAFPSSNPQTVKYFHDMLGYKVVGRGKPSKRDGQRRPSLAKKFMFKLRLQYDNPVIDFCIAYRQTALETNTPLGFTPWKDDNGKVINWRTYHQDVAQQQALASVEEQE